MVMVVTDAARPGPARRGVAVMLAAAGLLLALAWFWPYQWSTVSLRLVEAAGAGSPSVEERAGREDGAGRPATAALWRAGLGDTPPTLADLAPPVSDPVFLLAFDVAAGETAGRSALAVALPTAARRSARAFLEGSRRPAVAAVLAARRAPLGRVLAPVDGPRGGPTEAALLLAALLLESGRLEPGLATDLEVAARAASTTLDTGPLERTLVGVLGLARRLGWDGLVAVVRTVPDADALEDLRRGLAAAGARWPVVTAAILAGGGAAETGGAVTRRGEGAVGDLATALAAGPGAVGLVAGAPREIDRGWHLPAWCGTDAGGRRTGQAIKGVLLAAALALVLLAAPRAARGWGAGAGLLLAGAVVLVSEPGFGPPPDEPGRADPFARLELRLPDALDGSAVRRATFSAMNSSGLASVALFAALQIAVYVLCLARIRAVVAQPASPLVRLRLLENEDNLFDLGLYVGIGGTALSLVVQVMGVVESNLLAAYSSNLMGILCVAVVKIRHVRPARRRLILEAAGEAPGGATAAPASAPAAP